MIVSEDQTVKRALAVEGALAMLVGALVTKETISAKEALSVVRMLANSSAFSAVKHAPLIEKYEKLQSLEESSR
ncbi:MAG: hypothetical protein P0Y65_05815 [Candidatus Devosia phytovorans]|uniref:Uncharacterized protein n=1 Tax=Candidatus Devosia phytovorans TaxID=3121372 RepID=A0AAJ5VWM1_9HYPH|nr:hypothetical protein [Devosia sp.]WEK05772.1 MAG: hypothetical protein P0Y65_05815 [Devosia sp.]